MRDTSVTLSAIRNLDGRITFRDTRLIFDANNPTDGTVYTQGVFHDVDNYGTGFLRVASVYDGSWNRKLYYQYVSSPGTWPAWVDSGRGLAEGSGVAVFGGRIFYHSSSGGLYYADFDGSSLGAGTSFKAAPAAEPHGMAPVSLTDVYIIRYTRVPDGDMNIGYLEFQPIGGSLVGFPGALYNDGFVTVFDAVRTDKDYVYFGDSASKRALYTTRVGSVWSEIRHVIPLDVVDETSLFILGGVSVINNKMFMAGVLKRDIGKAMHTYSIGPKWSLGRDMFIRAGSEVVKPVNFGGVSQSYTMPGGKLLLVGTQVWYVSLGVASVAAATTLVGVDNAAKKIETKKFSRLSVSAMSNESFRFAGDLSTALSHASLRSGSEFTYEMAYGGDFAKIGVFEIDALGDRRTQDGRGKSLIGRSKGMKRLSQWQPDANFDYWSQIKMYTNPADRTKVIRASGKWDGEDAIYIDQLNVDGYLYSIERPSSGMIVRGRFKAPAKVGAGFGPLYNPIYGLVANYYKESKVQAAERLGMEMSEITEFDYGHNGIVLRYSGIMDASDPGIRLFLMRDNLISDLSATVPLVIPADTWHWFMMYFQDGYVRVFYRLDTSETWSELISVRFEHATETPWFREDKVGRGALYLNNYSPHSRCFSFGSTDMIIPVYANEQFPLTETVIVDSEQILYSGKSKERAITNQPTLKYVNGDVIASHTTIGDVDFDFANVRFRNYVRQTFKAPPGATAYACDVYVRKSGDPQDGLVVSLYQGPILWDEFNTGAAVLGYQIARGVIPASEITTSYQWITCPFQSLVTVPSDCWIILTRENEPANPDPDNFYQLRIDGFMGYDLGQFESFNDDTDLWTSQDADMPFVLYGSLAGGEGRLFLREITAPSDHNEFDGMGLAVVAGQGMGALFKVIGFEGTSDPVVGAFLVDRSPRGVVGPTSEFHLVPTLYVVQRGYNDTVPAPHAIGTIVSVNRPERILSDRFGFYSTDVDMRLEDMLAEVAGKAGVALNSDKALSGNVVFGDAGWNYHVVTVDEQNCIVRLKVASWTGTEVGIGFRLDSNFTGLGMTLSQTEARFYQVTNAVPTLRESVPLDITPGGWMTFGVEGDHFSIWVNDRLVASFSALPGTEGLTAGKAMVVSNGPFTIEADWSQTDVRVDNYIMDMGTNGSSMVNDLIRERRVFIQDDQHGDIRIFRDRVLINGGDPYSMKVSSENADIDQDSVSRIRLVGDEIIEEFDEAAMREYGNVFALTHMQKLASLLDLKIEADLVLRDAAARRNTLVLEGAADPRVEPNDVIEVTLEEGTRTMVVESVTLVADLTDDDVALDMSLITYENP